jgi:ribosomal protein S9
LFERNRDAEVAAAQSGSLVEVTDVVMRDTKSQESDDSAGRGLNAQDGARITLARGLLERNRDVGLFAGSPNSSADLTELHLTDVVVRDTRSKESDKSGGRGLDAEDGAQVTLARGLLERNRCAGLFAQGAGTKLDLTDVAVRDTQSQEKDMSAGRGLNAHQGATVTLARGLFERNREVGLFAETQATKLDLTEVVVRDTRSQEAQKTGGRGLNAQDGAQVTLAWGLFEGNRETGVAAFSQGTMLDLTDVVVRDTQSSESDKRFGFGFLAAEAAQVRLTRGLVAQNRYVGLLAADANTRLEAIDVTVRDTRMAECAEIPEGQLGSCVHGGVQYASGTAVAAVGGETRLRRFSLSRSAQCGIQLVRDGRVTATEGEIHHNPIGLNVQVPGYDLTTILGSTVRVHDNNVNLDSNELPIPNPGQVLAPVQ